MFLLLLLLLVYPFDPRFPVGKQKHLFQTSVGRDPLILLRLLRPILEQK